MTAAPIYYRDFPYTPMPRKVHPGRWSWVITDGMTGPVLAEGTALTERAALRARLRAADRCRSEQERLDEICARLLDEAGLRVEARYDEQHRLCVHPCRKCSDREHRLVMGAFFPVDSPVLWEVA